ncbi:ribonuclease [uncultured Sphingomonas sp.]|uniref:ribonuclease n=1 Tax=uncultured Sphingomonas sp. TaxID=158754 RepID=UPI0035CBE4F5
MAEWLYEAGIGEARAALIEDGAIVAAAIEPEGTLPVGTMAPARLIDRATGRVRLADGIEALLAQTPPRLTEGAGLTVEVTREAIAEAGRVKPARVIVTDAAPRPGPALLDRLAGPPVRRLAAHEPDALEEAGWSELLEEARTGDIAFPGGALRMTPTPAMTLFDVDGAAPLEPLAVRAAVAIGRAVRRHGIAGSIGIDFPTLAGKAARQAVAAALDAALDPPFERTAMNGFGFLQVVRPRLRASLPELLRADPIGAGARAALRRLEREPPGAPAAHRLPAAVLARLETRPDWLAELARRTGVTPRLECA